MYCFHKYTWTFLKPEVRIFELVIDVVGPGDASAVDENVRCVFHANKLEGVVEVAARN